MSSSDKEKVMPPKKSKAARKTDVLDEKAPNTISAEVQKQNGHADDPGKVSDAASSAGLDQDTAVNIFQEQMVEGKRKRNAPVAEQMLKDWLEKNFVEKENSFLLQNDMYQSYLESCSSVAAFAMDYMHFHKTVSQMFPKGQALVDDSPYKDSIREKKPKKKTTAKIQADSLHLKMKDIIKEAITDLGNPRKGASFNTIKNLVASKFPALRVDLRVNFLKNAISRELRFGHIECFRGVGACGYYRLPRTPEQEAEELEAEKKEAKEKALKKKEKKNPPSSDEKADESEEKKEDEVEDQESDKKESDNKESDNKESDVKEDSEDPEKEKKQKVAKKKSKKRKKLQKEFYVAHSEPQRIEDTFPLAMTYNSEPKEASVAKIRKYIKDFYKEELSLERLKKCLDTGVEHGFWFQVTGHGTGSGSFRLTINEFDPLADDDITGKVMNAIVACTEPKQSSALLLKKYVQDYHPDFRVAERPHLFKMALQRAVTKNKIVQLSGIGATGSFQLVEPFLPSPTVLQGKDTGSDIGESDVEVVENVAAFMDAYKPRPTKRRGMGRPGATAVNRLDPSAVLAQAGGNKAAKDRSSKRSSAGRGRNTAKKYVESTDEESEEEEEEPTRKAAPPTKRKAPSNTSAARRAKKSKVALPAGRASARRAATQPVKAGTESESEEYDSEPEEYTPRKTVHGGANRVVSTPKGGQRGRAKAAAVSKQKSSGRGKKGGRGKSKDKEISEEEEEEEEEEEVKPPASVKKGKSVGKGKKLKAVAKQPIGKGIEKEKDSSESEDDTEVSATPKSSPKGGGRLSSAARMRAQPPGEDDDEKKESAVSKMAKSPSVKITISTALAEKGSPGSGKRNIRVTNVAPQLVVSSEDEEGDEEDEKEAKAKKPKVVKSKAAGKKKGKKMGKSRK